MYSMAADSMAYSLDVPRSVFVEYPKEVRISLLTPVLHNKEQLLKRMKTWNERLYDFLQEGKGVAPEVYNSLENELAHLFIQTYMLSKEEMEAIETYTHDNDASDLCSAANEGNERDVKYFTDYKLMKSILLPEKKYSPYFQLVIEGCNSEESFLLCLQTAKQLNKQLYIAFHSISEMTYKTTEPFKVYGGNKLFVPNTGRFASTKPGDNIILEYPLSTSVNLDVAYGFCMKGVIIMGTVQPGTSVTFIGYGKELEILLPPGTRLTRRNTRPIHVTGDDVDVIILDFDISIKLLSTELFDATVDQKGVSLMESIGRRYEGTGLPMLEVKERPESDSSESPGTPPHKNINNQEGTPPAVMTELKRAYGDHLFEMKKGTRFEFQEQLATVPEYGTRDVQFDEEVEPPPILFQQEMEMESMYDEVLEKPEPQKLVESTLQIFHTDTHEYLELFKYGLNLLNSRGATSITTRGNQGPPACRHAAMLLLILFFMHTHGLRATDEKTKVEGHTFFGKFFPYTLEKMRNPTSQGFRDIHEMFLWNHLTAQCQVVKNMEDITQLLTIHGYTATTEKPIVLLMGVSGDTADGGGSKSIIHHFNLIIYANKNMELASAYGNSYVSIRQYKKTITLNDLNELIAEIVRNPPTQLVPTRTKQNGKEMITFADTALTLVDTYFLDSTYGVGEHFARKDVIRSMCNGDLGKKPILVHFGPKDGCSIAHNMFNKIQNKQVFVMTDAPQFLEKEFEAFLAPKGGTRNKRSRNKKKTRNKRNKRTRKHKKSIKR